VEARERVQEKGGVMSGYRRRRGERGFSLLELAIAMLLIVILITVVILMVSGFFSGAREAGLETDLSTVKTAVDAYYLSSFELPTADGRVPAAGEYALIDFGAGFTQAGRAVTFYPHFIAELPRHWDEGVWRLDSAVLVSVDLDPVEY